MLLLGLKPRTTLRELLLQPSCSVFALRPGCLEVAPAGLELLILLAHPAFHSAEMTRAPPPLAYFGLVSNLKMRVVLVS